MISGLLGISKNVNKVFPLRIAVGISALFLVMVGGAGAVTPINDCTTISSPGTYALTRDIGNSANSISCISITSSDVIFDGSGYTIDGIDAASTYGVYVYNPSMVLTNVNLKNMIVKNWKVGVNYSNAQNGIINNNAVSSGLPRGGVGISLSSSHSNTLNGNNAHISLSSSNSNILSGNNAHISLDHSNNNMLSGNNATLNNNYAGISLSSSHSNTLSGNNVIKNHHGIILYSSNSNILSSNIVKLNEYGINLVTDWNPDEGFYNNNTIINNDISNNNYGIFASSETNTLSGNNVSNNNIGIFIRASNNTIYNNLFNNVNNYVDRTFCVNKWNIAKTAGTNIVGGPYIGGNVWAYPSGTGYSQTCNDVDGDGICDSSRTLDASNIDSLPLVYRPIPTPAVTSTITTVKITATTTAAQKTAVTPTITTGKITPPTTVTVSPNVPGFKIVSMILGVGMAIFLRRRKK